MLGTTRIWLAAAAVASSLLVMMANAQQEVEYGVDVSFPMHHKTVSTNYAWLPHNVDPENNPVPAEYQDMAIQPLGDMKAKYDNYIQGCVDHYNAKGGKGNRCLQNEHDRIVMTLRQPQGVYNYTKMGYTKIRAPDHVFKLLKEFWETNKGWEQPERWHAGNIYTYVR